MHDKFYYDSLKNVKDYIKMAAPYSGEKLIELLKPELPENSTILELGIGPGKDMDMLSKNYRVTGSDLSKVFIDEYRKKKPGSDLFILDAQTIKIDKSFDCIYSNKVLHHLSKKELNESLQRQKELLNPGGIIMHSFWEGDREEFLSGLRFIYYKIEELKQIFSLHFNLIGIDLYEEELPNDSIWVMGRV